MAKRPTIDDLARAAGVSVATVDRVLNGRARVREETARKVYDAARQIGYHAAALIGQRMQADLPEMHFGFVFHKEKQAFYKALRTQIETAVAHASGVRGRVTIAFAPSQLPADFAALMDELSQSCDAIGATAVTHVEVTDTVVRLQERGVPCFAMLNDFAQGVRQSERRFQVPMIDRTNLTGQ